MTSCNDHIESRRKPQTDAAGGVGRENELNAVNIRRACIDAAATEMAKRGALDGSDIIARVGDGYFDAHSSKERAWIEAVLLDASSFAISRGARFVKCSQYHHDDAVAVSVACGPAPGHIKFTASA